MTAPLIRVAGLTRRYGDQLAVDGVSFEVRPGEIVGFLGPNGAGKSTVLRMLSTYLPPTSGELEVAGHDIMRDPLAVRRRMGCLTEHNALFDGMRVRAFLDFVGGVHGLRGDRLAERRAWVVERTELASVLKKRIAECSKGFRQRVGLAAALIHDPPVLLLDEPTHGLDPLQVVAFRDFVRELSPGRAILFSSHILAEVAEIATRLLVIQGGRICLDARVDELEQRAAQAGDDLEGLVLDSVRRAEGAA
ncbi:MAG: ATP-binding cassette domain-containing protein [Planctomycetes bacterium]|nr:ATP-binding cassette domain-containing protein [Planctomycetota bacterium]MCB9905585.1 ATP-binding cassette domain-containing protein [Planctomycetota bacterium]